MPNTTPKKKKKRPPPTPSPPKSSPEHTNTSGNTTSHALESSYTPLSDQSSPFHSSSPFQSLYDTPNTHSPTPLNYLIPNTSTISFSEIVITHQQTSLTNTTPTFTTVNTITTTALVHSPPRVSSRMSTSTSPATTTLIPTTPKLTPIIKEPFAIQNPSSKFKHTNKKPRTLPNLSDIEVLPASQREFDSDYTTPILSKPKHKKKKFKPNPVTPPAPDHTTSPPVQPNTPPTIIPTTPPNVPSKNIPPIQGVI